MPIYRTFKVNNYFKLKFLAPLSLMFIMLYIDLHSFVM